MYSYNRNTKGVVTKVDKAEKSLLKSTLLNEGNRELLLLTDKNGIERHYKQIATIKRQGELFCILKPLDSHLRRDEAILFKITDENELEAQDSKTLLKEILRAYRATIAQKLKLKERKL